jgi:hypothetical protein
MIRDIAIATKIKPQILLLEPENHVAAKEYQFLEYYKKWQRDGRGVHVRNWIK